MNGTRTGAFVYALSWFAVSVWGTFGACQTPPGDAPANRATIVKHGKMATAYLVIPGARVMATAFCVEPSGYFVTNEHVVKNAGPGKDIELYLNSNTPEQKKFNKEIGNLSFQLSPTDRLCSHTSAMHRATENLF